MISLPNNQSIVEDINEDAHIDQNDLNITLTYAEHQLIIDVLMHSVEAMDFACPYGLHDLPMDSEIVQRYTIIENLRERFNESWSDRFKNNELR